MALRSKIILAAAVVAVLALLYQREQSREQQLASLRRDVESLSMAAAGVRFERGLLPLQPGHTPGAPTVRLVPVPGPHTPQAAEASPGEPRPELSEDEMGARMDVVFQGEARDAGWAQSSQQLAEQRLRAALPDGSTVKSVECRQTMCRIEANQRDPQVYEQFINQAFRERATQVWNGGFMTAVVTEHADGTLTTVTFLARDGEGLPSI